MSLRNAVLFDAKGLGTTTLAGQWRAKAAEQPYQARAPLVERDGSATRYFREVWRAAFPDRDPLPFERIAEADGRGSTRFWDVFGD